MNARLTATEGSRQPTRSRFRLLAALFSGVLQFLAFPPVSATYLVFVALVPLFWAVFAPLGEGEAPLTFRRRFLLAFAAEAVYFAGLLHWILFLSNEEVTVPGIMIPALLFLSGYMALFSSLAVAVSGAVQERGGPSEVASLPIFWTLCDRLRSAGPLAFPWGSLGYALAPQPALLQLSAWTGFWGLTFWILAVNGVLAAALLAWQEGKFAPARVRLGASALVFALPLVFGLVVLAQAPPARTDAAEGLRLALLQPNTSREIKWKKGYEGVVVNDLLDRTRRAAELQPDLIVWPETAAPLLILWTPDLAIRVRDTVAEVRRWVLVGTLDAVLYPGNKMDEYNAAVLYDSSGAPVQRYYKSHLVPFSEAMPFQKEAPWINALNFGQSNFSSGKLEDLFQVHGWRFSCLICFESIFPELSRRAVLMGSQYLINTTNDFWFGRSAAPVQHALMAVHRAVENRTPLARCANSGISFFVDPYGRVMDQTDLFVGAMPVGRLAPGHGGSFYTRHGDWIIWSLAVLGLVILVLGLMAGGRLRDPGKGKVKRVESE